MMSKYRNSIAEGFVLIEKARTWESAISTIIFIFFLSSPPLLLCYLPIHELTDFDTA